MNYLLPGDEGWRADKELFAKIPPLIAQLGRYVLRYFDADAGQAEPTSAADERALAEDMTNIAVELRARADRHATLGEQPLMVEGSVEHSAAIDDDREEP